MSKVPQIIQKFKPINYQKQAKDQNKIFPEDPLKLYQNYKALQKIKCSISQTFHPQNWHKYNKVL